MARSGQTRPDQTSDSAYLNFAIFIDFDRVARVNCIQKLLSKQVDDDDLLVLYALCLMSLRSLIYCLPGLMENDVPTHGRNIKLMAGNRYFFGNHTG